MGLIKSMDITNLKVASCINKEELDTSKSKNRQINATLNIAKIRNNHEDNAIDNFVGQEEDRNVNSMHYSSEEAAEKKYAMNNENLHDTCIDKNPSKRKKNISTFDNNKYINLSQETDYEVPQLKILGRIETEFKFTSMFYINLCEMLSLLIL